MREKIARWFSKLTMAQAFAFVAGVVGLVILVREVPVDTAKQWAEVLGGLLAAVGTAGALLHGRETGDRAGERHPTPPSDPPESFR